MARRVIVRRRKTRKDAHRHAVRRAAERYGVTLTKGDIEALAWRIRRGRGVTFLGSQSSTRSVWLVEHAGLQMKAIYQKRLGAILTFLSMDMVTTAEKQHQAQQVAEKEPTT